MIVSALVFCLGLAVAAVAVWFGGAPAKVAFYALNEGAEQVGWDLGEVARPKSFMPIVLVASTAAAVLGAFAFMASVTWGSMRYQPRRRVARAWRNRPGTAAPALAASSPAATSPAALPAGPEPAAAAFEALPLGSITAGDPLDFAPPER
jgi:hypothetical protein